MICNLIMIWTLDEVLENDFFYSTVAEPAHKAEGF